MYRAARAVEVGVQHRLDICVGPGTCIGPDDVVTKQCEIIDMARGGHRTETMLRRQHRRSSSCDIGTATQGGVVDGVLAASVRSVPAGPQVRTPYRTDGSR